LPTASDRRIRQKTPYRSYLGDISDFGRWFTETNGEGLTLKAITPIDVRVYRRYLVSVAGVKPSTVNRRLAALGRLCHWARAEDLIEEDPTEGIKGVSRQRPLAPKSLRRREMHALVRAA